MSNGDRDVGVKKRGEPRIYSKGLAALQVEDDWQETKPKSEERLGGRGEGTAGGGGWRRRKGGG